MIPILRWLERSSKYGRCSRLADAFEVTDAASLPSPSSVAKSPKSSSSTAELAALAVICASVLRIDIWRRLATKSPLFALLPIPLHRSCWADQQATPSSPNYCVCQACEWPTHCLKSDRSGLLCRLVCSAGGGGRYVVVVAHGAVSCFGPPPPPPPLRRPTRRCDCSVRRLHTHDTPAAVYSSRILRQRLATSDERLCSLQWQCTGADGWTDAAVGAAVTETRAITNGRDREIYSKRRRRDSRETDVRSWTL